MKTITIYSRRKKLEPVTLSLDEAKTIVAEGRAIHDDRISPPVYKTIPLKLSTKFYKNLSQFVVVDSKNGFCISIKDTYKSEIGFQIPNGISLLESAIKVAEQSSSENFEQLFLRNSEQSAITMVKTFSKFNWRSIADGGIAWKDESNTIFCTMPEDDLKRYKYIVDSKTNAYSIESYNVNEENIASLSEKLVRKAPDENEKVKKKNKPESIFSEPQAPIEKINVETQNVTIKLLARFSGQEGGRHIVTEIELDDAMRIAESGLRAPGESGGVHIKKKFSDLKYQDSKVTKDGHISVHCSGFGSSIDVNLPYATHLCSGAVSVLSDHQCNELKLVYLMPTQKHAEYYKRYVYDMAYPKGDIAPAWIDEHGTIVSNIDIGETALNKFTHAVDIEGNPYKVEFIHGSNCGKLRFSSEPVTFERVAKGDKAYSNIGESKFRTFTSLNTGPR